MKTKMLVGITLIVGLLALGSLVVDACPMHIFSIEDQANILLQPVKSEIANLKADLVAGEIEVEQYLTSLESITSRLQVQTTLLEAIADSGRSFDEKIELLLSIFPWNVR